MGRKTIERADTRWMTITVLKLTQGGECVRAVGGQKDLYSDIETPWGGACIS